MTRASNPPEFEDVYRTHWRFVWRSLHRLGVPERDLLDASQEVFVVVYRKLPEFEGRSKVAHWLFSICLRVASDRRRRAYARREVLGSDGEMDPADPNARSGDDVEERELLAQLESVLALLSEEQRTVLILFELEGMTGAEIAEVLKIPVATVHSRLRLAREGFRRGAAQTGRFESIEVAGAGGGA